MSELKPRITENGIDYILVGDYYIPGLKLPEEHRPTDETRIVLLKIWQELYTLSPALFAPGLTGSFCQRDKCLEGKMACGRKIDADITPEDLLKADYPALSEGGAHEDQID